MSLTKIIVSYILPLRYQYSTGHCTGVRERILYRALYWGPGKNTVQGIVLVSGKEYSTGHCTGVRERIQYGAFILYTGCAKIKKIIPAPKGYLSRACNNDPLLHTDHMIFICILSTLVEHIFYNYRTVKHGITVGRHYSRTLYDTIFYNPEDDTKRSKHVALLTL